MAENLDMTWSFKYEGPREPVTDAAKTERCPVCMAMATGFCCKGDLAHDNPNASPAITDAQRKEIRMHCPSCVVERRMTAGKPVVCHQHCGLAVALEHHAIDHREDGPDASRIEAKHSESFEAFKAHVLAVVASLPAEHTQVRVEASGYEDLPDPDVPYASFSMSIVVPRTRSAQPAMGVTVPR